MFPYCANNDNSFDYGNINAQYQPGVCGVMRVCKCCTVNRMHYVLYKQYTLHVHSMICMNYTEPSKSLEAHTKSVRTFDHRYFMSVLVVMHDVHKLGIQ